VKVALYGAGVGADGVADEVASDVADEVAAATVADALATLDDPAVTTVDGPSADADLVVAVGDAGARAVATAPPSVPTLPVGYPGPLSIPPDDLPEVLGAHDRGETWTVAHPSLAAGVDGRSVGRALADVTLMTAEPARISEYAVATGGRRVDDFRADGVVVATPLGSAGYARDAGGPVVTPGGGLAVVPVAPFATRSDTRVVAADVSLTVVRDDAAVVLLVDDRETAPVPGHATVSVRTAGSFPLLRAPTAGDA
jgi:NAD+ kinase